MVPFSAYEVIYGWNKENRIYIRVEFTRKKRKTAILLFCFHTAGVLHIFILYNLLGPRISLYRKSKIIVKRKPNYEIGWFHNWPMIISHRLYAFHFTNDDLCTLLHIICEHLHDLYTLNSLSGWKGLKKFIPRDFLNSPLIYILFSMFVQLCFPIISNNILITSIQIYYISVMHCMQGWGGGG